MQNTFHEWENLAVALRGTFHTCGNPVAVLWFISTTNRRIRFADSLKKYKRKEAKHTKIFTTLTRGLNPFPQEFFPFVNLAKPFVPLVVENKNQNKISEVICIPNPLTLK
jgi:hypothetical protein